MNKPSRPDARPNIQTPLQKKPAPPAPLRKQAAPAAPPAYRPQAAPKVLQSKPSTPRVYRPQPLPKVLQRKAAAGRPAEAGQPPRTPVAPLVYRPQRPPAVLQPKKQAAPAVYRPNPEPKVLQRKEACAAPPCGKPKVAGPVAPPAYRPQPVQKCLQPKLERGRRVPSAGPGRAATIQAKFTLNGRELTAPEVEQWHQTHPKNGKEVPATLKPFIKALAENTSMTFKLDDFEGEDDPPREFRDFLRTFQKKLSVTIYDGNEPKTLYYRGEPQSENLEAMKHWKLGQHQALTATDNAQNYTEFAHVTHHASYFDSKEVSTANGSNPGEFGFGFYSVTAHDVTASTRVSVKWANQNGAPNDVVKFRVTNAVLSKLVDDEPDLLNFLLYVIRHPGGYPPNTTEDQAVALMDRINAKGKILVFPDNKDRSVFIKNDDADNATRVEMSWQQYTEYNSGPSQHSIVVGPQRPPELAGVRQIAFSGPISQHLLNSVPRRLETIDGNDPK